MKTKYNIPGTTEITEESIIVTTDGGLWAIHNFPCPVCREEKAVMDLASWQFHPCSECNHYGWRLINTTDYPGWVKWVVKFGTGNEL